MFTLGSDPEIILTNGKTPISCHSASIPGYKTDPHPLEGGVSIHRDNALLELCVPPSSTKKEWMDNHHSALRQSHRMLPEGIRFYKNSSADFPSSELWHPEAYSTGCSPDFHIWKAPPYKEMLLGTLRVAGGHVHIGYDDPSISINRLLTISCDIHLGLPSVLMDTDTVRRSLYGGASCFRNKDYGIEYRTLSNFWLFSDEYLEWVFDASLDAYNNMDLAEEISVEEGRLIANVINNYDKARARSLCDKYGVEVLNA